MQLYTVKEKRLIWTKFGYLSFYLFCIIEYSGVPLPVYIPKMLRFSRTLVNVMGECFDNDILQHCGKIKMGQNNPLFPTV